MHESIYLARLILNITDSNIHIDHKNNNTLDDKKNNLRETIHAPNAKNRKSKNSNNTTGYRNVILDKDSGKYKILLCIKNKRFRVGKLYMDVHEAGKDAEIYRKEYYKEFAGKS